MPCLNKMSGKIPSIQFRTVYRMVHEEMKSDNITMIRKKSLGDDGFADAAKDPIEYLFILNCTGEIYTRFHGQYRRTKVTCSEEKL